MAKDQIGRSTKCERVDVTTLIANSIAPLAAPGPDSMLQVAEHIHDEEGQSGPDSGQGKCRLELGVCRAGSEATIGRWSVWASRCRHLDGATPVTAVKKDRPRRHHNVNRPTAAIRWFPAWNWRIESALHTK